MEDKISTIIKKGYIIEIEGDIPIIVLEYIQDIIVGIKPVKEALGFILDDRIIT